jgi:glycosyltransferase involved in cell wall biosynthesis
MRVLMVTDFYAPHVGGVEQHVRSLSHALVRAGHTVAVATLETPQTAPVATSIMGVAEEYDGDVCIYRIRSSAHRVPRLFTSADRPWSAPILDPAVFAGLRRVVAAEDPDVIHGHDWLARSAWPLCLGRRALVLSLHYYTRSCATKSLWSGGSRCAGPGARRCASCAAAHYGVAKGVVTAGANRVGAAIDDRVARSMIAVSDATASGNAVPARVRCRTIPNLLPDGVPRWDADPAGSTGATSVELPDEPFLLYVGDLRAEKGLDVLLAAYAHLVAAAGASATHGRAAGDRCAVPPLVLLGEAHGRATDDLPAGVVAVGPVPNEAVLELWRRSLFGVVPSVWAEPFGIVVIEAMAAGRTVVASRVGGIPEVVDHDRNGVLVAPGDPQALAAAIAALVADPDRRTRLEAQAALDVQRYRADVVAAEVEQVYRRAVAGRRAS